MATTIEMEAGLALLKAAKKAGKFDKDDVHIWDGIIDLLECSELGTKDAEVEVALPAPSAIDPIEKLLNNDFDNIFMTILRISKDFLSDHGFVCVELYSQGLTRSLTIKFKVKRR